MLDYLKNKLTIKKTIDSADTIVSLYTDTTCEYLGVLTLSNKAIKTISFINEGALYKARLVITEEDIPYINNCTFHLVLIDNNTSKNSNSEKIIFDVAKVKRTVKLSMSKDIRDIKASLTQLEKRINTVASNAPSFLVTPSTPINTEYVQPGMIPVAIDSTGRCIFQYPFIDQVTEINGQKTVNNAIILTAKDIPVEQTDVAAALKAHTEAIKELLGFMTTVSNELKGTQNKVAELEKALLLHTDSSII